MGRTPEPRSHRRRPFREAVQSAAYRLPAHVSVRGPGYLRDLTPNSKIDDEILESTSFDVCRTSGWVYAGTTRDMTSTVRVFGANYSLPPPQKCPACGYNRPKQYGFILKCTTRQVLVVCRKCAEPFRCCYFCGKSKTYRDYTWQCVECQKQVGTLPTCEYVHQPPIVSSGSVLDVLSILAVNSLSSDSAMNSSTDSASDSAINSPMDSAMDSAMNSSSSDSASDSASDSCYTSESVCVINEADDESDENSSDSSGIEFVQSSLLDLVADEL